jgi:two-component system sensor histidine kinase EvgS
LIVDDIEYNRMVLEAYLIDFPFEFLHASNGKEALELVYEYSPDIVLLDMKMPVMDGYDFARRIRRDHKVCSIPLLAVTASVLETEEALVSRLCQGYVRKPVSKAELILELAKFLPCSESKPPQNEVDKEARPLRSFGEFCEVVRETGFKELVSDALQTQSFNHLEKIGEVLQQLVTDYPQEELVRWGKAYAGALERFDIPACCEALQKAESLLENLEEHWAEPAGTAVLEDS